MKPASRRISVLFIASLLLFVSCDVEQKKTFTVTLDTTGGVETAPITVEEGEKFEKPENPVRKDGIFLYWTLDKESEEEYTFGTLLKEDITLYAVWKTEFNVGDTGPAGGKIFYKADRQQESTYINRKGEEVTYTWRYLEASAEDITVNGKEKFAFGLYRKDNSWDVATNDNVGSSGENTGIGKGRYNTTALVYAMDGNVYETSESETTTSYYAAKVSDGYSVNGFDDWFLPSTEELKAMYDNISTADRDSFKSEYYMSSTEYSKDYVWAVDFSDGTLHNTCMRSYEMYIRAARAF